MGMENDLGLVKEGYLADLLIVTKDPIANIALFQKRENIAMIMKDGAIYKPLASVEAFRIAAE